MTINAPLFENTVHKTTSMLEEVQQDIHMDEQDTLNAVRVVMHTIRDRITPAEAADMGAQLPTLMRGIYYEGFNPDSDLLDLDTKEELVEHVRASLPGNIETDPELAVHATMRMLGRHVSGGEILDVVDNMPQDLKKVWRDAAEAA